MLSRASKGHAAHLGGRPHGDGHRDEEAHPEGDLLEGLLALVGLEDGAHEHAGDDRRLVDGEALQEHKDDGKEREEHVHAAGGAEDGADDRRDVGEKRAGVGLGQR